MFFCSFCIVKPSLDLLKCTLPQHCLRESENSWLPSSLCSFQVIPGTRSIIVLAWRILVQSKEEISYFFECNIKFLLYSVVHTPQLAAGVRRAPAHSPISRSTCEITLLVIKVPWTILNSKTTAGPHFEINARHIESRVDLK